MIRTDHPIGSCRRPTAFALAGTILAAWASMALAQASAPADGTSATVSLPPAQPQTTQPFNTVPAEENISDAAIELTPEQRAILADVPDGNRHGDETGIKMLLRLVDDLPKFTSSDLTTLDEPAWNNLVTYPHRYRGQMIRMQVRVFRVRKLTPPSEFGHWRDDRPVYEIGGLNAPGMIQPDQPVLLYSVEDPSKVLGKPTRTEGDRWFYDSPGRGMTVGAVYYRVARGPDQTGASRLFPWMVVADMQEPLAPGSGGLSGGFGGSRFTIYALIGVLIVILLFYYKRMKDRGKREEASAEPYRFQRFQWKDEHRYVDRDRPRPDREPDEERLDGPVDPDLTAAAAEWRKQHGLDDEPEDRPKDR